MAFKSHRTIALPIIPKGYVDSDTTLGFYHDNGFVGRPRGRQALTPDAGNKCLRSPMAEGALALNRTPTGARLRHRCYRIIWLVYIDR